jgi:hypothetical protein
MTPSSYCEHKTKKNTTMEEHTWKKINQQNLFKKIKNNKNNKMNENSQIDEALLNFRIEDIILTIKNKQWKISKKVCTLMKLPT